MQFKFKVQQYQTDAADAVCDVFEGRLGLAAKPFDAKKASGLRFYKSGCKIKGNEAAWPEFIGEQMRWALEMKKIVAELGL